jgi:hypothetical protein
MIKLWEHIVNIIAEDTDCSRDEILSERHTEAVDARHLLIKLLHEHGIYPKRIASLCRITTRTVHYVLTNFDTRIRNSVMLRKSYERIKQRL